MPDPAPRMVRVYCPRCGRSEVVPDGDPETPWLPKFTDAGPFMAVSHANAEGVEHVGIYCRSCWNDVLATFVKSFLPATQREPADATNAGPATVNEGAPVAVN